MSIVIDSNDYVQIGKAFGDLAVPSPLDGFDILLFTRRGQVPIERKKIPSDLIASVNDGRLAKELRAMRQVSRFYIVLLHGTFIFRNDDTLVIPGAKKAGRDWTRKGIKNLLRTLQYVEGVYLEYAEDDRELVEVVQQVEDYFNKSQHLSLRIRPGLQSNWLIPSRDEKYLYWMQGLPKISAIRAKQLLKVFPTPLSICGASIEELSNISGIGKTIAGAIYNFIRGLD